MVNCFLKKQNKQKKTIIEHRCYICNTKIPTIFIKIMRLCKCEYYFCPKHIFPEYHNCTYDYKAEEREKLKKVFH